MVLINSPKGSQITPVSKCELKMESGVCIKYIAPSHVNPLIEICAECTNSMETDLSHTVPKKRSSYDGFFLDDMNANDPSDDWEGVNALCQAIDTIIQHDLTDMAVGKNVLELGFCTGLPSVFVMQNGASHVTLYCADDAMLSLCVKPTLSRNSIEESQQKFVNGDFDHLKESLEEKQFDVILATEFLNTERASFEQLHDIIDYALAPDGICLFSSRMYYFNCDGSLPEFLELVKSKGKFESYTRWTSPKSDVVQRKVVQLTRTMR
ncbi:unnamed protein product [Anisakis simplex]|uniref:Methyltransf_11 domain-containing protein n=1 Tax=Anisakis simplex TaxID=6269 RepID=A0A0M3JZI2_ANISI|nr:unnamed protein product [Anisakis simplex]